MEENTTASTSLEASDVSVAETATGPVVELTAQTETGAESVTEQHASVTATPSGVSLGVVHDWRRQATAKQLERLWHAMELSRTAINDTPGDENLQQQRDAFSQFATALLGNDAPVMEVLT